VVGPPEFCTVTVKTPFWPEMNPEVNDAAGWWAIEIERFAGAGVAGVMGTVSMLAACLMEPPPPLTVAMFTMEAAAVFTETVSVMALENPFAGIAAVLLQVTVPEAAPQFQLLPNAVTKLKPAGKTSVTVTVDVVADWPVFSTVIE
jgi:hypothetical protein